MPKKGEKLSPEHKAAMAAGRARKQVIETADQIAERMAAGHERREALKANADETIRRAEGFINETGAIAIDPAKLDVKNVDNEIASRWNPEKGDIPFDNPQKGYLYAWVTREESHSDMAKTSIRAMHAAMRRVGWLPVTSANPEGKDHQKDATGMPICGDTGLWRIRREEWAKVEEANRLKAERDQIIEQGFFNRVNGTGVSRALGTDTLTRVYGAERMQPITYSAQFSPNQIRR